MGDSYGEMGTIYFGLDKHAIAENGELGGVEDFVSSWLIEDGMAQFGRVAGLLVMDDGSLLISEDTNGIVYRVSYGGDG